MKHLVVVVAAACGGANPPPLPPPPAPAPAPPVAAPADVASNLGTECSNNGSACGSTAGVGGLISDEGSGSGDAGWSTIGVGRYGEIGHPAGSGEGYGTPTGRGARRGTIPKVTLAVPTVRGDFEPAIVRRYLKRNFFKMQYCYEKNLLANDALAGTVTATFTILPSGTVAIPSAIGVSADVSSCIAEVVKDIEFPKPKGGKAVGVKFTLAMQPTGGE